MAEAILRNKLKAQKIRWWECFSRGMQADVGGNLSENSRIVLAENGISTTKFKPQQLTQAAIEKSFVAITMTETQKQVLIGCGNIQSVKDICGFDIPDPYGGNLDVYRATYKALDLACDEIIKKVILPNSNR
jgi:protein-tyrosine phosphatase